MKIYQTIELIKNQFNHVQAFRGPEVDIDELPLFNGEGNNSGLFWDPERKLVVRCLAQTDYGNGPDSAVAEEVQHYHIVSKGSFAYMGEELL